MATKSKNTKLFTAAVTFSGMVSWVSMLSLLYAAVCASASLIFFVFDIYPMNLTYNTLYDKFMFNSLESVSDVLRILALISLLALASVLTYVFKKNRKDFDLNVANLLGHMFVELKIIIIIAVCVFAFYTNSIWIILLTLLLTLYLLCLDIGKNHRFFSHNSVLYTLNKMNKSQKALPFEIYFSKRLHTVVFVVLGVIALFIILFSILWYNKYLGVLRESRYYLSVFFLIILAAAAIVGAVSWYSLTMKKDSQDLTQIIRQIEKMYAGDLDAVNNVPPVSSFYDMAMQLNMIRTGIQKAVDEGIKADKTKVELITNVSHDIKTPLTSIITYIELLKQEQGLSETAKDYINTISGKADRLSRIVQDVFEISKAATGNLNIDLQALDIGKLLHQTMAEMDENMKNAPISWRIEIDDTPALVYADGQKLYRVFQNLIRNCIQYSLEGSRAYISMNISEDSVSVVIRNISKKELEPSAAEYLTGRFVRGDQTRSSEGSGLGLSIAKSFTEAFGGKFTLRIEGDVFYTLVQLPLIEPASKPNAGINGTTVNLPKIGSSPNPANSKLSPVQTTTMIRGIYPASRR